MVQTPLTRADASRDLGWRLAQRLAVIRYEDIPSDILELARIGLLDTFASAIAGTISPIARKVTEQVTEWGGREESTVWGFGGRLPAPQAALINAMLVHTLDLDAVHDEAIVHGFTCAVPAAVVTAEAEGISGRDLLTAAVVGTDFALRLGLACGFYRGFILTATLGGFGATVAAAKALGLDAEQTLNAIGVYYSQAAGNRQAFADAASTTRYQPGFSARNGVVAAYFARRGLSGARRALEGPFGYLNLYFEGDSPDLEALTDGLGERFELSGISFKPYPTCRGAHAPIDAVLALVEAHEVLADQVEEVVVRTPTSSLFSLIGRPFEVKPDPHVDAQYSIPYAVACAVVRRGIFVQDLLEGAITDPAVLAMAGRVRVLPTFDVANKKALTPVEVDLRLKDGRVLSRRVEFARGHPSLPMSRDEIVEKLHRTVQAVGAERLATNVERIVALVDRLEELDDVRELGRLLG